MTFGEKLQNLRKENGWTQEELAEKLFVTRTAISKWETDKGFPSIDSLKLIANTFGVTLDELISDEDVENKKRADEQRARKMYFVAMGFLAATVLCALLAFLLNIRYLNVGGIVGMVGYIVFALLAKPKYKRLAARQVLLPYILSRVVILAVVVTVIVLGFLGWIEIG
ncbi:MAG: helix-turn-helix transcriptional regulator [Clostridia bacterium]|nr:helix-turn-helix transcriptional regulator [Clostridia bacterium]